MLRRSCYRTCAASLNPETAPSWSVPYASKLGNAIGFAGCRLVELAAKLTSIGAYVTPSNFPKEELYKLPRVVPIQGVRATIADNVFIAPSAVVAGDVKVGRKVYVGYNAIIRANEGNTIVLGESCNVQEKAVITGNSTVGKWVSVEPMAVIDSADIASCSFVGANSIVNKGAKMESNTMLCAAAVLQSGATIPSGEVWAGNPATKIGNLTEEEKTYIVKAAKHMVLVNLEHHDAWEGTWEDITNVMETRAMYAASTENNLDMRIRPFYVKEPPRPNQRSTRDSPFEIREGRHRPGGGWESNAV